MTDSSRRRFLRTAVGGALVGGAMLLPGGVAPAEADAYAGRGHRGPHRHRHRPPHRPPGGGLPGGGSGTTYSLTVVNESTQFTDFSVYQADPDLGVPQAMSLAWLVAPVFPQTGFEFQWDADYSFVWARVGTLAPGVVFEAAQSLPADTGNGPEQQALFTYQRDSEEFSLQADSVTNSPQAGDLYLFEDDTIPPDEAAVGLGMSGAAAFAVQAEPNQNLVFTPHPQYWVTAGTFEPGQVLDTGALPGAVQLDFGSGTALTATYQADGQWSVAP